jgi:pyrroline-5-carboxylate reductase
MSGDEGMVRGHDILLIGAGNMGTALLKGWLAGGSAPETLTVVEPAPIPREAAASLGVRTLERIDPGSQAPLVVLAIKPQQLEAVLGQCRPLAARGSLFLSIVAGRRLDTYRRILGSDVPLVRAMPNTPAAIGSGMTVLHADVSVTRAQRTACDALMRAVGATAWVDAEDAMDAVTAISGSGPAYVFLLIEALTEAAVRAGLEPGLARQLALETVAGSGQYARAADVDAAELRRRVTSPGGTTAAALDVLLAPHGGLVDLIGRAVRAAVGRSRELG